MHLGRFRSGILQGRIKVAKEIFFPRIFSGKWKSGRCREFQGSKVSEWLRFRSSALCFLQVLYVVYLVQYQITLEAYSWSHI